MNRVKKSLAAGLLLLLLIISMAATWLYSQIDGSLPQLEGKTTLFGLEKSVMIERDSNGVATITADNRQDLALATGFLHAQERFFQMDTLRRNAAGELSSLFGATALSYDKSVRIHRFRQRAEDIVQQLSPYEKIILDAYTTGVNEGLRRLKAYPFEYLLLQQRPVEWRPEDSILAVFSMYLDLQHKDGKRERTLGLLQTLLNDKVYQFLNPKGSVWDAALDGTSYQPAPLPDTPWPSATSSTIPSKNTHSLVLTLVDAFNTHKHTEALPGSNNWAVSGALSQTGSAIVANDMHLTLRIPNTWYRARFIYQDNNATTDITGITLPGTPTMVSGSNGHISWGFTNSYGDFSDVIVLETNEQNTEYLTPEGFKPFINTTQMVAIKQQLSEEVQLQETIWGPVIGKNHLGQLLAYRWTAHDSTAVNLGLLKLESAATVKQAFTVAANTGIPAQNMVVGDKNGNIGWTIIGKIPKRNKPFGETPVSWAKGKYQWNGYLPAKDYPSIYNPKTQRLWTANARVVGGDMLKKLGNGGYALGARAKQISQRLFAENSFDETTLLDIALDDNAVFLDRWHEFIIDQVLTTDIIEQYPDWQEAKTLLLAETELSASVDSVSYRLIRNFRLALRDRVFSQLAANMENIDKSFEIRSIRHQLEIPLWQLVTQQPNNFLWLPDEEWQQTFILAFEQTFQTLTKDQDLTSATWGQQNTAAIQHPLAKGLPLLSSWLSMPTTPMPGDSYMPRVQSAHFGASQRMVVSPGYEEHGIFHMPTSQASHPWSPYFAVGHQDWLDGKTSPFLPGKTKYTLTLLSY
ncbi:penicillin acylase family protein [Thalassotalea sp. PP2-459]|uniref:penicillin acylase family protein n=1 Tax=Thalassotalea sp. PP2-459 TaxID=1742724 RepID=UPI00094215B5|nr:penicillin acylase family protein [Thalassotalea sp. PP2-459]OKY26276.1 penicillin acylase family protein [Thalassotalea sp. PP2-459]